MLSAAIDQLPGDSSICVVRSLNTDLERVALCRLPGRNVLVEVLNPASENLNLLVRSSDRVPNPVLRLVVLGSQSAETAQLGVDVGFLDDQWIPRRDSLDLGVCECRAVDVLDMAQVTAAGHDLVDEFGFRFERLPHVGVETAFGDVPVNLHLGVAIALPENSSLTLLHVRRTPRRVEVVQRNQPLLHIRAGPDLLRAAHEDADFAGANILEKRELALRRCRNLG